MATPQELMEIGQKLVDYCNAGQEAECLNQLYSEEAVSVEAMPMPGQTSAEAPGLEAIRGKHDWWNGAHEIHSSKAEGPYVHGDDRFSVIFDMDVTNRESGERTQMRDIGTYFVNDAGKIVREEFAYPIEGG
ncbi:MAG: SnoaL-like domain-containing protein [Pseudomonadota bacterium]